MRPAATAAFALLLATAASAREPAGGRSAFKAYGDDSGLTDQNVEALLQDRQGFLWVGTDNGLFRFDGRRFVRFGREDGLPSVRINVLHETRDGRLYVGTRAGLARRTAEAFAPPEGLPATLGPVFSIASDPAGTLFVGVRAGLFVGQGDTFRFEPRGDGKTETAVDALHVDSTGALWFGRHGELWKRWGGKATEEGRALGLPSAEFLESTITDRENRLWVRTHLHLYRLDPGAPRFERDDNGLPEGIFMSRLALSAQGEPMVTTGQGLAIRERDGWRVLDRRGGLDGDAVMSALVDREGSLWLGAVGSGLVQRLGWGAFDSWNRDDGLSNDVVWSIARDSGPLGALWVGTQQGLDRADPVTGTFARWSGPAELEHVPARALAPDRDGGLWVGYLPGGAIRIAADGSFRRFPETAALHVVAALVASNGDVWLGCWEGVRRLRAGAAAFEDATLPGAEPQEVAFDLAEGKNGDIFAAGRFGLQRLGPRPLRVRASDGLRAEYLAAVVAEPDGSALVGYREPIGVDRVSFENGKPRVRSAIPPGRRQPDLVLVRRDAGGALWLGTTSGADLIRRDRPALHFGRWEGLPTDDLNRSAFYAEADGHVWLGTSRGLVRYSPWVEQPAPVAPPAALTDLRVGELPLPIAPLQLERDGPPLTLSWAGLTFLAPHRVRFRWRLVGQDDAFTETSEAQVRLANLASGRYRFEVFALAASGMASERPATLQLEVLPAWWERWWARAGLGVAAVALAGAAAVWRDRRVRRREAALQALVEARGRDLGARTAELDAKVRALQQRTQELEASQASLRAAEADAAHAERLEAMACLARRLAHELHAPLDQMTAQLQPLRRAIEHLGRAPTPGDEAAFAREAAAAARELPARLAELSEGSRRAGAIADNLNSLLATPQQSPGGVDLRLLAQEAVARASRRKPDEVELNTELEQVPHVPGSPAQLEQVVQNLLDNALRAVPARGSVRLKLAREGQAAVRLEVRDDGVGMTEEVRRRATEPFFTTRPVGQGTGLGLAIVQSIVASLDGTLAIESSPGAGTTVVVRLPAGGAA